MLNLKITNKQYNTWALNNSVFWCGAVVMIFELTGSRLLAPYLGNSIYVWTSLIGVILGSLSLGYWWGGKLADKKTSTDIYAAIIFGSAISIFLVFLFKTIILESLANLNWPIEINSFIISLLLFAPSSVLMGIISPYATRIKLNTLENSASTIGNLYALSTLGSITGTFLAGFYLIPHLGTDSIIILIIIILTLTSLSLSRKKTIFIILFLIATLISFLLNVQIKKNIYKKYGFLDLDTEYNKIFIFQGLDSKTKKPTLNLATDPYGIQSAMFLEDREELVFDYTKFYNLAEHFQPNFQKVLLLGGCAYSYPKNFLIKYPESFIDVVEIDPGMTTIAKKYFYLKENPRLNIFHQDARVFLNKTQNKYDVILGDAFNSFSSIPFHLTTIETVQKQYKILNDNGVVILNLISSFEGQASHFFKAEYKTYSQFFPQIYVFQVKNLPADQKQNIILVALKSDKKPPLSSNDQELNIFLKQIWTSEVKTNLPILTDDFAPVEYYKYKSI